MLILASNTDQLQLTTNNAGIIDVHASWMDNVAGAVQPGRTNIGNINAATTTTIVASPAAGTQRNVKTLHIRNRGTGTVNVTVLHTDGTNTVQLHRTDILANATLQYIDEVGFLGGASLAGAGTPASGRLVCNGAAQTTMEFKPYNGDLIKIDGSVYQIPTTGVVGLANTGVFVNGTGGLSLTSSTFYNVYCFNNNGVLTADFSTTGHAQSTKAGNIGIEIKISDDTRSLIGIVMTGSDGKFHDTTITRLVRSWFNRTRVSLQNSVNFNTAAAYPGAIATQLFFINFANELVIVAVNGPVSNDLGGGAFVGVNNYRQVWVDGVGQAAIAASTIFNGNAYYAQTSFAVNSGFAEGVMHNAQDRVWTDGGTLGCNDYFVVGIG